MFQKNSILMISFSLLILISGCSAQPEMFSSGGETWGIYYLDLITDKAINLHGSSSEISGLSVDPAGERLVFSQMTGGIGYEYTEIYTLSISDRKLRRLTENSHWDLYPVWSTDGTQIAYLSWRDLTLDIYQMDAAGTNQTLLFDSGFHDADIDWVGEQIVFTSESRIWIMASDGSTPRPLTDPPRVGEWGQANLPFGDYDPRLSPDGSQLIFSRLVDDQSVHGNYDLYLMDIDDGSLQNLTGTGYSQGLSSWSPSGSDIVFIVSAMGEKGIYDLYSIKVDGSNNTLLTPESFPPDFLIHAARYSQDGTGVYFIGQWWSEDKK